MVMNIPNSSFVFCLISIYVKSITAEWTLLNTLPLSDDEIAAGAYNGTIFLLGGFSHQQQTTEYSVSTGTFSNPDETALSQTILGGGQYWTQQDPKKNFLHEIPCLRPHEKSFAHDT
eukprot:1138506_1